MRKISEREGEKMIWQNARNVKHTAETIIHTAENVILNWDSLTERQLKEHTNVGNAE